MRTKGRNLPLIKQIAAMQQASESNMKYAGLPNSCVRATVYDIDDPENRGRVRVVFDDFNPNIPQVQNAGDASGERIAEGAPQLSHWIDVSPSFRGKQSKGLLGKRVNIVISNRQYQYALLGDVIYDPEMLTEKAGKNYQQPNNSSMTRMPVYETGQLPPPCAENFGCTVIEDGGPLQSDWLCVCLKRNGEYYWVRHIDASHGHAGQNDSSQPPDNTVDSEKPVNNQTVWDYTFPTTAGPMQKFSDYGDNPRPNPFGGQADWIGPAQGVEA
jgi:hypothetical protein